MRRSTSSSTTPSVPSWSSIRACSDSSAPRRSRRIRSSVWRVTSSVISCSPGKAEAKITPVSSRNASGSDQRSGSCVPVVVVL